jgi:hypothetical protein
MPFLLVPAALAAVGGTAWFFSSETGTNFIDELGEALKEAGTDLMVSGVILTALSALPLSKKQKITIGAAWSAYLIAKIKSERVSKPDSKSVLEKAEKDELKLDNTWLF